MSSLDVLVEWHWPPSVPPRRYLRSARVWRRAWSADHAAPIATLHRETCAACLRSRSRTVTNSRWVGHDHCIRNGDRGFEWLRRSPRDGKLAGTCRWPFTCSDAFHRQQRDVVYVRINRCLWPLPFNAVGRNRSGTLFRHQFERASSPERT